MHRRHLTAKQHEFFGFICDFVRENGVWPTYRIMKEEFGFRSPNSVTQNLNALVKKGYLTRHDDGFSIARNYRDPTTKGIPVRGIITAGAPQDAIDVYLGELTLHTLFPRLDQVFALRVAGDSMSGAGINDGDYVLLVEEQVPDGEVGAVLVKGETTLKYVHRTSGGGLRLEPANDSYQAIHVQPDEFDDIRLVGRYIGRVNQKGVHLEDGLSLPATS